MNSVGIYNESKFTQKKDFRYIKMYLKMSGNLGRFLRENMVSQIIWFQNEVYWIHY